MAKRIVLVATVCPTCGTLRATWTARTTQSVTISLSAAKQATKKLITLFTLPGVESGTLTLKVTSSGKPVQIDGLAVSKH